MTARSVFGLALGALAGILLLGLGSSAGAAPPPARPPGARAAPLTGVTLPPPVLVARATAVPPLPTRSDRAAVPLTGTPTPSACGLGWRPVAVPDSGVLQAVSGAAPDDVWTGGNGVLHWDGTAWTPVPGPYASPIADLAAVGPHEVWALDSTPLHWNGTSWARPAFPTPTPNTGVYLYSLTGRGPSDVWAIGGWFWYFDDAYPLLEHWDGSTWTFVCCSGFPAARPNGACHAWELLRVGAEVAPGDLWGIGTYDEDCVPPPIQRPVVLHCPAGNCTEDTSVPLGTPGDVGGTAANDVWIVGGLGGTSAIAHWDGASWSSVPSPDIGDLLSISVRAANDVWAASAISTLHWDGSTWTQVPLPNPLSSYKDMAAVGDGDVWLVGGDATNHSQALHYSDPTAFVDVPPTQPFYPYISWMACQGYISGYVCGGPGEPCPGTYFRPGLNVTRGQLLKMVALAAGWPLLNPPNANRTFEDVPSSSPFSLYIEAGAAHSVISGYHCGGANEPCVLPDNRPYFRAETNITRGQLSKVIALAKSYSIVPPPGTQTFHDVPTSDPFYGYIEAMAAHSIVSGYTCGGPNEPCDPSQRPYFRAGLNATRGQVSKFVTLAYGDP